MPEEEEVKPVIELDVQEPPSRGPSRMAGEKRVRKLLFRVKRENEDGQLEMDESCKMCLGEDHPVPEGERCTASRCVLHAGGRRALNMRLRREAIMHVFGGNSQETYPRVSKDVNFARIKKGDYLICGNRSYNPDLPAGEGRLSLPHRAACLKPIIQVNTV